MKGDQMNDNGKKIRDFVWDLKEGQIVTYGYIAEKLEVKGAQGVGAAIKAGFDNVRNPDFPCWRVIDANFHPTEAMGPGAAKEKLKSENWEFLGNTIHPSMRHLVNCGDSAGNDDFKNLPEWDLSDLYKSETDPQLDRDFQWLASECREFAEKYKGKLAKLDAEGLLECIKRKEKIDNISSRIMSFAFLRYAQLSTSPERASFNTGCAEKVNGSTTPLVFFGLEINSLEEEQLNEMLDENRELARYAQVLRRMRAYKPHQLSEELENFLHDMNAVGAAWCNLFDETMAGLTFRLDDREMGLESALNLLTDHDEGKREAAFRELARVFRENIRIFSRIHNTSIKEKEIIERWRKLPTAQSGRHLNNDVEPEIVEALRDSVVKAYPDISHRYYELKRKWMGKRKLQIWDRNAPLPLESAKTICWDEAVETVMQAYSAFDPKFGKLAEPFFKNSWIDAGVKNGKMPGAFAHPTVTDVHPYLMLNYLGKPRDVMTLAHELGHGVHQVLAAGHGEYLSDTPLTLAETASVFGEMLTFQKLLNETGSKDEQKVLLAGKVEDMINTVIRQIAFYDFECRLHSARRERELTPDEIGEIWMSAMKDSLGSAFEYADGFEVFWSYVPHFIHSPFYVYAYAFGDGLVNALYAVYRESPDGFQDKYIEMLKAGGSKHHKDLLAPFGLDASDPEFWSKGLSVISDFIDRLEALEANQNQR